MGGELVVIAAGGGVSDAGGEKGSPLVATTCVTSSTGCEELFDGRGLNVTADDGRGMCCVSSGGEATPGSDGVDSGTVSWDVSSSNDRLELSSC